MRLVEEAVVAGLEFRGAIVSPELERTARGVELRKDLESRGVTVQDVAARTFAQLADTDTPQGIVAIVEPPSWKVDELPLGAGKVILIVDGVQDPGNVGTLIRTAHALGAVGTIVLRGTADAQSPKALRAAMGATFRHPVISLDDNGLITWARKQDVTLWAAAADGTPLHKALDSKRSGTIAVIVGNEGAGIRPHLNAIAAVRVAIPLTAGAESLNVAVAAGILLYEVGRGR